MKGLNIKKIAAIGLGAALVGSALAPAVMAGAYTNLTSLTKANIVDSVTGVPVVDIIVGSQGLAPDVVWAGNIAAKVAQMATIDVAGSSGTKTVNISVGGTQTTTGSGNTDENVLDFTSGSSEFAPIKADYSDSSKFVNISGRTIKYSGVESQINIDENVNVTADAQLQTIADGNAAGETVASVGASGIVYSLNLGTGIPYDAQTNWDDNSSKSVKIPLLGSEYVVTEATSTKLVLYKDTTAETINTGESIEVDGVGSYAGKKLTLTLTDLTLQGTAANYKAQWTLADGTTTLMTKETTAPAEVRDLFGTSYFNSSVYMSAAGLSASTSKLYATIRTGSSRLEIRNGEVFPYDSTMTTNPQWKGYITSSATALNGSVGVITKVQIKNNWAYNQSKTETTSTKLMLAAGSSILLPENYAKFTYKGLQTKPMAKAVIGGSTVTITDSKGIQREIPMVISLGQGSNTITIAGSTYFVDVNTTPTSSGVVQARYWTKPTSSVPSPYNTPTGTLAVDYFDVCLGTNKDTNEDSKVGFTVDTDWKSGTVEYVLGGDTTTSQYWLFLAAQAFDVDSKSDSVTNELIFAGTDVDQNANNGLLATTGSVVKADLNYYLPDSSTYNVLTAVRANTTNVAMGTTTDSNVGNGNGSQVGKFYTPSDGDVYQYVSFWKFNEGSSYVSGTSPATTDVNFYVNGQTGYLVQSSDNKTRTADADKEVKAASFSLDEYTTAAASKLTKAVTNYGTEVSVSGGVATILMPEEVRKVEAYVGSMDTVTSTVGGESFTGVTTGETKTTTGGTKVTVDAISGASSGKQIVPVGNIVKLDSDIPNGKSIIVGGFLVNTAAANLTVDGVALTDRLVASGDYVSAVLADGKIVVAGWTAADTGAAARDLISALDGLM